MAVHLPFCIVILMILFMLFYVFYHLTAEDFQTNLQVTQNPGVRLQSSGVPIAKKGETVIKLKRSGHKIP
jgi:hypothetical protein